MKNFGLALCVAILTIPAAVAADHLPPREAPAANPWSRPYIGVFGGAASGTVTLETNQAPGSASVSMGGLHAGIRAGYDFAHESFLVGVVGDYAITSIGLGGSLDIPDIVKGEAEYRLTSFGTLRARLSVIKKIICSMCTAVQQQEVCPSKPADTKLQD